MKCRYCNCEMQEISTTVGETMQILGREWRCICGVIARETWAPKKEVLLRTTPAQSGAP